MRYKEKDLKTYAEIIDYALALKGEAQREFVEAYAKTSPYALQNVGYFSGYYDSKTGLRIQRVFKTAHPIFGRRIPSPDEAFEAGKKLARELVD